MASLREWLIKHEWYIVDCDPVPEPDWWVITAWSPSGRCVRFMGTGSQVMQSEDRTALMQRK